MRKLLLYLLVTLCHCSIFAQPYQVGHLSITFIDSARGNRAVPTEIYYPADVAGDNVAFASAVDKSPYIAFGHGFVMTYDAYSNIRDLVVPAGYIIAFPTTEGSLSPVHSDFGKDLAFVLQAVAQQSLLAGSILYNHVAAAKCVMGHSMGGGAAFLAAAFDTSIKAMVTFAAAETTPSAIAAASGTSAKALVFAGLNDCITSPATNQEPMYTALTTDCKHYIGIKGASHCQMSAFNAACNFGELTCSLAPTISRDEQHAIIDSFLLPWLDYTLGGSCAAGSRFDNRLLSDTGITYMKNCTLCISSSVHTTAQYSSLSVYPNPATHSLTFNNIPDAYQQLCIYTVDGKQVVRMPVLATATIAVDGWPAGSYFYQLSADSASPLRGVFCVHH